MLLLQECFRKLDGVNVGAHELFTPSELGRIAMSGYYRQSKMERTIEDCRGCGKMDCGRAGRTADPHFSTLASQREKLGEFEAALMEIQEFVNGRGVRQNGLRSGWMDS